MGQLRHQGDRKYKTVQDLKTKSDQAVNATTDLKHVGELDSNKDDMGMLSENVLEMDKMDLLLHVQKIQLNLEQEQEVRKEVEEKLKNISNHETSNLNYQQTSIMKKTLQKENELLSEQNRELSNKLENANRESDVYLLKLKAAESQIKELKRKVENDGEDVQALDAMQKEITCLSADLTVQTEKRKRMEMLFQDISEREMKIQQLLEDSDQRVQQLEEENLGLRMANEEEKKGCEKIKETNEQLCEQMNMLNLLPKNDADNSNIDQTDFTKVVNLPTDDLKRDVDLDNQQEEILKMLRESEAALESKIKEVETIKEKLIKADDANHKLIVESQVLKREILDIKESTTKDKHVSISQSERHKREREQLLKEIDTQDREIRKMREEQKKKDQIKDTECDNLEKQIVDLSDALSTSKSSKEQSQLESQKRLEEEKHKNILLEKRIKVIEAANKNMPKDQLSLELEALVKKNDHLRTENENLANKLSIINPGRCHRGTSTGPFLGSISEEKVSTCQEDERNYAMDDLANELVSVKNELTMLKTVLEEKDKELTKAKSMSSSLISQQQGARSSSKPEITMNPELQKLADDLKLQLHSKENQLLEVDLKLQFSERKVGTYDSHVNHLRERVNNLEAQLEETTKVNIFSNT